MIGLTIPPEIWGAIAIVVAAIITGCATVISKKSKTRNQSDKMSEIGDAPNPGDCPKPSLSRGLATGMSTDVKSSIHILFIDDERFENVSILKKAGWLNTKTIKDIKRIDAPDIQEADIVFVDINGVGAALFPKEQGLGVATQIKKTFPSKFVVVYSAQPQLLHSSFTQVDAILPKNAEPYEYLSVLESFMDQKK